MKTLRRIAAASVLTATVALGGLAAQTPAAADPGTQMHVRHGPFSTEQACQIDRFFNPYPTTSCYWKDWFDWYYTSYR